MNPKSVISAVVKATSVAATALLLTVGSPSGVNANPIKGKKISTLSEDQVSVQYTGTNDKDVVFRVEFDNPSAQKFFLIVRNDAGMIVYQEQFSDTRFMRNVLLPKDEGEIHPTIAIRAGNQQVERSFVVKPTVTEEVVVTKL